MDVVASTITFVSSIISAYKAIHHLGQQPREFQEVAIRLPLVRQTLCDVQRELERDGPVDEMSRLCIENTVSKCMDSGEKLLDIFQDVARQRTSSNALVRYKNTLVSKGKEIGKAHRVELLMTAMLKSVRDLADNQIFRTATRSQVVQLAESLHGLAQIVSSVPDADIERGRTGNSQNIAAGGKGTQENYNTGTIGTFNKHSGGPFYAGAINTVVNTTVTAAPDIQRIDIMRSLSSTSYKDAKESIPDRVEGTCVWFTEHAKFKDWNAATGSSLLFVSADPGCGKSVLARYLVNDVLKQSANRVVCHFFFHENIEAQNSAVHALQCILHQLFTARGHHLTDSLLTRFQESSQIIESIDELWELVLSITKAPDAGEIVCVIDAFDECAEVERNKLARLLKAFYRRPHDSTCLKFLITSRSHEHIRISLVPNVSQKEKECSEFAGSTVIHLHGESEYEIKKISLEIDIFIRAKVDEIDYLSPREARTLLRQLQRIEHRTYLWVYLTLDWLQYETGLKRGQLESISSNIQPGVDAAYEKILSRSKYPRSDILKLLHIVSASARPLTLEEMDVALAIDNNHRTYSSLDLRGGRIEKYIRELCGLFISVIDSKIYFLHQTAKEFLLHIPDTHIRASGWKHCLLPRDSHEVLFRVCSQVLLLDDCRDHDGLYHYDRGVGDDDSHRTLFHYSALSWAHHYGLMEVDDTDTLLALLNMDGSGYKGGAEEQYDEPPWFSTYWWSIYSESPQTCTPLGIAAYFGLFSCASLFLTDGINTSEFRQDDRSSARSALSLAAENGHADIVNLFLTHMTSHHDPKITQQYVDESDSRHGRSALMSACLRNHVECVELLLDAGASTEVTDILGVTALLCAAGNGNEGCVALLLDAEARTDHADNFGKTALIYASQHGHAPCVQLLLDAGAYTGHTDSFLKTALIHASEHGYDACIELLLGAGAHENHTAAFSKTALIHASEVGDEASVKLLLDIGASKDHADCFGKTALIYASEGGREKCVQLLLRSGASKDVKDFLLGTATLYAYCFGHKDVAALLGQPAVPENVNAFLHQAVSSCRTDIVEGLLRRDSFLIDEASETGDTPLLSACKDGHVDMAVFLIDRGADISMPGSQGYKPLWYCTSFDHVRVFKAILANTRSNNHLNEAYLTGLLSTKPTHRFSKAERHVYEDVKYTLSIYAAQHDDVDFAKFLCASKTMAYRHTGSGMTALHWAILNRSENVIRLLLDGSVNLHTKACWETPLHHAVLSGSHEAVRELVSRGANLEAASHIGRPLHYAAIIGSYAQRSTQADKPQILYLNSGNPSRVLRESRFPHCGIVARNKIMERLLEDAPRDLHILKQLLEYGADVNGVDSYGRTPLFYATAPAVIRVLIDNGADVAATDINFQTPLMWASIHDELPAVRALLESGANVHAVDYQDLTALQLAITKDREAFQSICSSTRPEIVQLLLQNGAKASSISSVFVANECTPGMFVVVDTVRVCQEDTGNCICGICFYRSQGWNNASMPDIRRESAVFWSAGRANGILKL